MSGIGHDLKVAARAMRMNPGFSAAVIGMLALAIAGNTAIFSIFDGLFLRPLPFAAPDRLIDLDETAPKWDLHYVGISTEDFYGWQKASTAFESMGAFGGAGFNLSDGSGLTCNTAYGESRNVELLPNLQVVAKDNSDLHAFDFILR